MNRGTIAAIARDRRVQIGTATVVSAALGGLGGYEFAKRKLKTHYEAIADEEIQEAKDFYARINKKTPTGEDIRPEDLVEPDEPFPELDKLEPKATEAFTQYSGIKKTTTVEEVEVKPRNIFLNEDGEEEAPGWDFESEKARRSGDRPYVITEEEFLLGEKEYEQMSLTYFEGDDVLSDDQDVPVPDPDETVGEQNLTRFGQGTKHKNMVHIRNEKIQVDFEIMKSTGAYQSEVHGFLEHSFEDGVRKFRKNDD